MFDVLASQIQLPINDASAAKLDILSAGFSALAASAGAAFSAA